MKLAPVLQTRSAAVVRTAIASRTLVCLVVALSSFVAPAYDDSRSVSDTACSPTSRPDAASDTAPAQLSRGDVLVNNVIGPLANWDGVYFLTIAQHGYQFEQYHAFFPLLPLLMRAASATVFAPIAWLFGLSYRSTLLLAGITISNASFVLAAVMLYRLGKRVVGNEALAFRAALMFCATPAGVFGSALYTESLFALCTFAGLSSLASASSATAARRSGVVTPASATQQDGNDATRSLWPATLMFALAAATRSNGIVLGAFLVYETLVANTYVRVTQRGLMARAEPLALSARVRMLARLVAQLAVVCAPYLLFQAYGYYLYCASPPAALRSLGMFQNLAADAVPPGRPWCSMSWVWPPSMYSFVQSEYWGVGFLRYMQLKQLPQFVLAAPILGLTAVCAGGFVVRHASRVARLLHGILRGAAGLKAGPVPWLTRTSMDAAPLVPYMCHWLVLGIVALLFMHVQVATRFLSACPPVYWSLAQLWSGTRVDGTVTSRYRQHAVALWCGMYTLIGSVLFGSFYPWT